MYLYKRYGGINFHLCEATWFAPTAGIWDLQKIRIWTFAFPSAIMTYKTLYIDGEETMMLEFESIASYNRWAQTMSAIKQEADNIIAANPDKNNLSIADVKAIRNWLKQVDALVEARTPVSPSILKATISFREAISDSNK